MIENTTYPKESEASISYNAGQVTYTPMLNGKEAAQ